MASNKDNAGSKGSSKSPEQASSDKKPKPLLDLKATEVRGAATGAGKAAADGGEKSASTSSLKGAPDYKPSATTAQPAPGASSESSSSTASTSGTSSTAASSAKPATSSQSTSTPSAGKPSKPSSVSAKMESLGSTDQPKSGSATPGVATAAGSKPASASKSSASSASTASSSSSGAKTSSSATSSAPKSSSGGSGSLGGSGGASGGEKRSGGGFFSTLSHLAVGIIGGAIALFAAEPIENQFGIALTSQPKIPAALEQRLAAVEAKQVSGATVGGASDALQKRVASLSQTVEAAEQRLTKLDDIGKQVAALSADVSAVKASGASPGTTSSSSDTPSQAPAETNALRQRLSKLESALATLSSATGATGEPAGIAPVAQFSAKFADLENSLGNQMASLRKGLMSELDQRVAGPADAAAKAVAGTERLDRDVASVKTEAARVEQRTEVLKAASDKLTNTMQAVREQAAELKVELDGLKAEVKQDLAKVARPKDVENAILPVTEKVAAIEKNLGSVIASEEARKKNAERIVLSLELSSLKRVLDRGSPYEAELKDVQKIAGSSVDFSALEAHSANGVPSAQALTRQFRDVAYRMINAESAPKDASRIDRLLSAAKSIVQVRRTNTPDEANTTEAAVARIEKNLKNGDMSGALAIAEKLPDTAKAPAKTWLSQLQARANVDQAIAKIEDQLKASLGGVPAGGSGKG